VENLNNSSQGSHDGSRENKHRHRHGHVLTRVEHVGEHLHRPNVPAEVRGRETERDRVTDMNDPDARAVTTPSRIFPAVRPEEREEEELSM
jgi:hypothetical protein